MYSIRSKKHIDEIFSKLSKKNPKQLKIIQNKLEEIIKNPYIYKPLKKPLQNKRRVHIDKSFVLVYSIDEKNKVVILEDYDYHDNIYRKWVLDNQDVSRNCFKLKEERKWIIL